MKVKQSESDFQKQVIQLARLYKWKVAHFRAAMNRRGQWSTPVQADGAGFPDLLMVRDRVIAAELKSEKGKTSPEQDEWIAQFRTAGIEAFVWKPADWDAIVEVLTAEVPLRSKESGCKAAG